MASSARVRQTREGDRRPVLQDAAWTDGAKLHFAPLSPVLAGPDTFAVELDTPDDAETVRDALARLRAAGRTPPFSVEDLAGLHAEKPFPKRKDPIYRPRS